MKKRILALVMSLCLLGATGCSSQTTATESSSTSSSTTSTATTQTEAEVAEDAYASWPEKAIEVVVPTSPGANTDLSVRLTTKYLEEILGVSFVIINMEGGGGSLGVSEVEYSDPDGYTALYQQMDLIMNCIMGIAETNWKDSLSVVSAVSTIDTMALFAPANAPYDTIEEMVEYAKSSDKKLNLATEIGTDNQLFQLSFAKAAGIEFNVVDLGGAAPRIAALVGNQADLTCVPYATAADYVESGDLKCLTIYSRERSEFFPDVPCIGEQGYDMEYAKMNVFALPAGTPDEIVNKFADAVHQVCTDPDYIAELSEMLKFKSLGYSPEETYAEMVAIEASYTEIWESLQ